MFRVSNFRPNKNTLRLQVGSYRIASKDQGGRIFDKLSVKFWYIYCRLLLERYNLDWTFFFLIDIFFKWNIEGEANIRPQAFGDDALETPGWHQWHSQSHGNLGCRVQLEGMKQGWDDMCFCHIIMSPHVISLSYISIPKYTRNTAVLLWCQLHLWWLHHGGVWFGGPVNRRPYSWAQVVVVEVHGSCAAKPIAHWKRWGKIQPKQAKMFTHSALKWWGSHEPQSSTITSSQ